MIEQIHFKIHLHLKMGGLPAKRTILERYTCRANLEQAEQFMHDSYELLKNVKYWEYLIMQNPRHGLSHEYLVFYFGKNKTLEKGNVVTIVTLLIIANHSRHA